MELLTVAEAARRIRVSRSFAYELARAGEIPTVRVHKRILVPAEHLNRWLERRVTMPEESRRTPSAS